MQSEFLTSATRKEEYPETTMPEVVVVVVPTLERAALSMPFVKERNSLM